MRFTWMLRRLPLLLVLCCYYAVPLAADAQGTYTLIDLGVDVYPTGINNKGQVVGFKGVSTPFLWDRVHGMQNLSITFPPDFAQDFQPVAINDAGDIAGNVYTKLNYMRAFLYRHGVLTIIDPPAPPLGQDPGLSASQATGIDAQGRLVGSITSRNGTNSGFLYDGGSGIQSRIEAFAVGGDCFAEGINAGRVVGAAVDDVQKDNLRAFLYTGGSLQPLGAFEVAYDINAPGQIVGASQQDFVDIHEQPVSHAVLYSRGQTYDLGTAGEFSGSFATGINSSGQVIGLAYNPEGFGGVPFLWTPSTPNGSVGNMQLLQSFILPFTTGLVLRSAAAINVRGDIVGRADLPLFTVGDESHGYVMTTTPLLVDSDGDGIPDEWERNGGYWYNGQWVALPGADPLQKDIYVQVDYMAAADGSHDHRPDPYWMSKVVEAFANVGIHLHVILGNKVIENDNNKRLGDISSDPYDWSDFDKIKPTNYTLTKSLTYHYCLFAHDFGGNHAPNLIIGKSRGTPGSELIVALAGLPKSDPSLPVAGTGFLQAVTFMHELGHNLGLGHGGFEDNPYKPNYLSVMSYLFNINGLIRNTLPFVLDYSHVELPPLDEKHLNETLGLNGGSGSKGYGIYWYAPGKQKALFGYNANGPIDWNRDGMFQIDLAADIDYGVLSSQGILHGYNDWGNLNFLGGSIGAASVLPIPMLTEDTEPSLTDASSVPLPPPTGLAARTAVRAVRLSWNVLGPATSLRYNVYRKVGNGPTALVTTTAFPLFSDTGLVSGVDCFYYVTAVNGLSAESDPSNTVTVTPR